MILSGEEGKSSMRARPPELGGGLTLLVAVLAVSWAAILTRSCQGAAPLAISFWRLAISAALMAPWALTPLRARRIDPLQRVDPAQRHGPEDDGSPGAPAPGRLQAVAGAAGAGAFLALHFACWISSLFLTTVASSVVLVAAQPLFTLGLSPLVLGEKPSRRATAGILLAFAGAAGIGAGDFALSGAALTGDLLALAGAAFASAYLIVGRRLRHGWPLPGYLTVVNATAALGLGIAALISGQRLHGYPGATWARLLALAAGPNLIGHGLLNAAVRRLPAYVVNMAVLGEPLLASLYAALLFGERPGLHLFAGGALVLAGICLGFDPGRSSPR